MHSLSSHSLISNRNDNLTNQLEREVEMGDGEAVNDFSRPRGAFFQSLPLCSDALSAWLMLGAPVGPASPSSHCPLGDMHLKAACAASPHAGGVASGLKIATCGVLLVAQWK